MPGPHAFTTRHAFPALLLGAGLMQAAPAAAQVMIYEGPYGPPRGYMVPPPPPGYAGLPPWEVRNIVRNMGYWEVSRPRLAGRFYVVAAMDDEGPVTLRVDAFTGRVVGARSLNGGPTIAIPAPSAPRRDLVPGAPQTPRSPSVARVAPNAPLPPPRPPEATMAAVTPAPSMAAPAAVPSAGAAPAASPAPAAPSPGEKPVAARDAEGAGDAANPAVAPAPARVALPAANAMPAANATPPVNAAPAGKEPVPQSASADPAVAPPKKAGAGTATTGSASAGSASVLSRPKPAP